MESNYELGINHAKDHSSVNASERHGLNNREPFSDSIDHFMMILFY
jgi:hypothetical protein